MSTTLLLSMVPATIETLTRLPISHPLATGPNDPLVLKALSGVLMIYVVGVIYQLVKYRGQQKTAQTSILTENQMK
jgi:hypothetical protein